MNISNHTLSIQDIITRNLDRLEQDQSQAASSAIIEYRRVNEIINSHPDLHMIRLQAQLLQRDSNITILDDPIYREIRSKIQLHEETQRRIIKKIRIAFQYEEFLSEATPRWIHPCATLPTALIPSALKALKQEQEYLLDLLDGQELTTPIVDEYAKREDIPTFSELADVRRDISDKIHFYDMVMEQLRIDYIRSTQPTQTCSTSVDEPFSPETLHLKDLLERLHFLQKLCIGTVEARPGFDLQSACFSLSIPFENRSKKEIHHDVFIEIVRTLTVLDNHKTLQIQQEATLCSNFDQKRIQKDETEIAQAERDWEMELTEIEAKINEASQKQDDEESKEIEEEARINANIHRQLSIIQRQIIEEESKREPNVLMLSAAYAMKQTLYNELKILQTVQLERKRERTLLNQDYYLSAKHKQAFYGSVNFIPLPESIQESPAFHRMQQEKQVIISHMRRLRGLNSRLYYLRNLLANDKIYGIMFGRRAIIHSH